MMHKCIMVKIRGKQTPQMKPEIRKLNEHGGKCIQFVKTGGM